MTAPPPAGGTATPTPHAAEAAAALEVDCIPPGTTNADLAAVFGSFCAIEKVVTVFEHASGTASSGGSGSALLLLPPSCAAAASALAAAKALNGHQLSGSRLAVRVCSSPAAWLQHALGPQLLAGGGSGQAAAAQHVQHASGERACGGSRVPQAEGPLGERSSSRPSASLCPSCAPAGSGQPAQLESTLEEQPSELEGSLEEQPSTGSLESLPPDFRLLAARSGSPSPILGLRAATGGGGGGSGSSGPSPHAQHLRRRGGSAASLSGSVGSEGSVTDGTIVVHNLPAYLSAREIGEFFMQFGEVAECHKPQGAAFAFVQYLDVAGAVRAKDAVHYKLVPQLNPNEALSIQFGKQMPSSRNSMGRGPTERGSSDGGSLEGSVADGGSQSLVVTNLDPGVPYKDVRAFFAQFGKVQSCYRQPQTRFAFITYAAPEAAVAALQAVDGTLCPELNPNGLIAAEYRRGVGARQSCDGGSSGHSNPALTFHPHAPPAGQAPFPAQPAFPGAAYPAAVVFAPFPPGSPGPGLPPGVAAWGTAAAAWPGAWQAGWPSPRSGPR